MTKTIVKIPPILMRIGALESAQPVLAEAKVPKAVGRNLLNIQTSNSKNYSQNPTNLDENWSVGILIACSSFHKGSQGSRRDARQHQNFK